MIAARDITEETQEALLRLEMALVVHNKWHCLYHRVVRPGDDPGGLRCADNRYHKQKMDEAKVELADALNLALNRFAVPALGVVAAPVV